MTHLVFAISAQEKKQLTSPARPLIYVCCTGSNPQIANIWFTHWLEKLTSVLEMSGENYSLLYLDRNYYFFV